MARRKKDPLRTLTDEEKTFLETLARARSAPADQIARATGILAVAAGNSYKEAAQQCHLRQGNTIAGWVSRFNVEGIGAVVARHGGGHTPRFTGEVKEKILLHLLRSPHPEVDGTSVWTISTLRKALAREGILLSGYSLWGLLREAGYTFVKDRSWCHTGQARRKRIRKSGTVIETVLDPDTEAKKN